MKAQTLLKGEHSNWHYFVLTFILFLTHVLTSRFNDLYYDSYSYWALTNSFDNSGTTSFSMYNFATSMRGYLLPLLHYPFALLSRNQQPEFYITIIKILGSLQAAVLFGIVCPELWRAITRRTIAAWQRLFFITICFVLWRDHFNFLLSDFPAVLGLLLAILFAYKNQHAGSGLLAGLFIAAAVYTRPVYIISVPFILLLLLYNNYKGNSLSKSRQFISLTLFIVTFFLIGLPQYKINKNKFNSKSFFVLTEDDGDTYTVNGKKDLYLWHLNSGLSNQRYETNVGVPYPTPQVFYKDKAGMILAETYKGQINSYEDYIKVFIKHPFDLIPLYLRHLFNAVDILYSSPYVYNVYSNTLWISLFNYTALFFAVAAIVLRIQHLKFKYWLVIAALLIPCATSIPLVIECRFMLPLHLTLYALSCFTWSADWSWRELRSPKTASFMVAYLFFVIVCLNISSNTQAMLEAGVKLLH